MDEHRPDEQVAQRLEHEADVLDDRLDLLGDHIDDAAGKADAARRDAEASRVVTGDWKDTAPDRPGGDDPEGAVDDAPDPAA
ncbi:hypothetical protein FSW04_05000 [Baekduia soli]|uniref:Uncharacterized protein n=1 Tax=Baekduia soli TaxID=496014 RepID=A0A5B8U1U1_9ACTN|nr:hypothetical protein [Baekduia soli]QEC47009.1 hypothetical protein FSW04_05000 [Baekduia soli]